MARLAFALLGVVALGCDSPSAETKQTPKAAAGSPPSAASSSPEAAPSEKPHNAAYEAALHACEQSPRCAEKGECGGSAHQRCYVRDAADCRASKACELWGRCSFDERFSSGCVAAKASDCLASQACEEEGRCTLRRGACVIDQAACSRWPGCAANESCAWEGSKSSGCSAGALDCEQPCAERGACAANEKKTACLATTEDDCRASRDCKLEGMCTLDAEANACVAASDEDCKASELCQREGRCTRFPEGDFCMPERQACESSCGLDGRCDRIEGNCHPTRAEHCREAKACEIQGRCSFKVVRASKQIGTCMATADDCAASLECKAFGRCQSDGLKCINPDEKPASSYAQYACLKDPACARLGRCLRTPEGKCVTPEEAARRQN